MWIAERWIWLNDVGTRWGVGGRYMCLHGKNSDSISRWILFAIEWGCDKIFLFSVVVQLTDKLTNCEMRNDKRKSIHENTDTPKSQWSFLSLYRSGDNVDGGADVYATRHLFYQLLKYKPVRMIDLTMAFDLFQNRLHFIFRIFYLPFALSRPLASTMFVLFVLVRSYALPWCGICASYTRISTCKSIWVIQISIVSEWLDVFECPINNNFD